MNYVSYFSDPHPLSQSDDINDDIMIYDNDYYDRYAYDHESGKDDYA